MPVFPLKIIEKTAPAINDPNIGSKPNIADIDTNENIKAKHALTPISEYSFEEKILAKIFGFHQTKSFNPKRNKIDNKKAKPKARILKLKPNFVYISKTVIPKRVRKSAIKATIIISWPNDVFDNPLSLSVGITSPTEVVDKTNAKYIPKPNLKEKRYAKQNVNIKNNNPKSIPLKLPLFSISLKSNSIPEINIKIKKPKFDKKQNQLLQAIILSPLFPIINPKRISPTTGGIWS